MRLVSERLLDAPASATVRIADLAESLRRKGADILDFSAGRASEHTPEHICRVASEAMLAGDTHQTMAQGKPEFRAACAQKLARENGLERDPKTEIIATMGCKQGLLLALMATLDPGDEILVEDPGFVSYQPTIRFCGATPRPVALRPGRGHRWAADDLESACSDRTRAILYCSPHNPTGVVHTKDDLEMIAELARRRDLIVIADETYERVTWGGRRHTAIATLPGMAERTVGLMGVTKSFSMGGWRIGFAYAPEAVISSMVVLQQHLMTCAGSFAQTGASEALGTTPPDAVRALWLDWEERCRFVTTALDALTDVSCEMPEGGFYAWLDISRLGIPSDVLAERLLVDGHVALVPGMAFGALGEGSLRMTCVKSWEHIRMGVQRIATTLQNTGRILPGRKPS